MIDEDLIREAPLAAEGLSYLVSSGVLELQRMRLLEQLAASGSADEPDEELLKRVKEYRLRRSLVESLLELGRGLIEEQKENNRE